MTDIVKLTADIIALQAEQAEIEEAIEFKKQKLAEVLGEGEHDPVGSNDTGWVKPIVYRSKQFNEAYGKKNNPELWEKAKETKEVVTSADAKAKLTEDEYAKFQKPSEKLSVRLEVIND